MIALHGRETSTFSTRIGFVNVFDIVLSLPLIFTELVYRLAMSSLLHKIIKLGIAFCLMYFCYASDVMAQYKNGKDPFKVIAFYTARNDQAHIRFVHEANRWFSKIAAEQSFTYDSTNDWQNLNAEFLSRYQVVIFLDTRPEDAAQRDAFKKYMDEGGTWMGFHFAGFALTPSDFPQDWDWYHNQFLGSGQYASNTWRPTSAVLRVEDKKHPATQHLPETFASAPNEWYRWENDLRTNPDIKILVSIDSTSFPLGTGPKPDEIWYEGYYPVVWTNKKYNMMYLNMGHNDIDYENKTNKTLSSTFANERQNTLVLDGLIWLGHIKKKSKVRDH